ncbi:hypothetical protein BRE01_06570 [Brevibacillus reuszeri]|uniref:Uncharacterized protein n=2 Tax=Brevibacillus reuszeri TaxID=54915 RepID=A0ABQ0TGD1_9BACL|nr:hypothetical protein [Brevibacillus reuszeri]MED1857219.1 hypothetical protein [Brevibacillus reuszeri]GED66955.1 hypothetical protein BRE01_06570 [Brevibacillus reuszeri]
MRMQMSVLSALFLACTLFIGTVKASWAYMFVVNNGSIYVISEEHVDPKQIGSKIGKVTSYSDQEGTYSGNFSNRYPKGTEYFEIIGLERKDAIAVKEKEGVYIKAAYEGEYAGDRNGWSDFYPYVVFGALIVFITMYFLKKRMIR